MPQTDAGPAQVFDLTAGNTLAAMLDDIGATRFVGYSGLEAQGRIVALLQGGQPVQEAVEGAQGSRVLALGF